MYRNSCSNIKLAKHQKQPSKQPLKRIVKRLTLVAAVALSQPAYSDIISATEAAALYQAETTYSIYRKGKKIGKHSLRINNSGERINVSVDSKITIRILKIPVFKFRYISNEVWKNDRLLKVQSTTTTKKKIEKAAIENNANSSMLTRDDVQTEVPLISYATNHWNISAVTQPILFNTVKGTQANVTVQKTDNETLQIGDTSLPVTHYEYSGDIIVESWYDDNNRWVKLAFIGSDGSKITYVIDTP